MKKYVLGLLILSLLAVNFVTGCRPDPSLDIIKPADGIQDISFAVPPGWPQPTYAFINNALTQQRFALGRKLFYETRLSRDNTISCGSCHAQFAAFSHLDHALSHGIDGLLGTRNAPGLFNMAWKPAYFWDGNTIHLEDQPISPIQNHVEMDLSLSDAVSRINADAQYKALFQNAWGTSAVTADYMLKSLAQFMAAMVSADSRYDQYINGKATLTTQEMQGLQLFRTHCAGCHKEPLFTDYTYRNNGLPVDAGLNDSGRADVTRNAADLHLFMVPSLRNVDLTRPYMHDGRFNTLDAAVEHYRSGIAPSLTLDSALLTGIAMTDNDKAAIIAFLKTLTDNTFIKDSRFSEPK